MGHYTQSTQATQGSLLRPKFGAERRMQQETAVTDVPFSPAIDGASAMWAASGTAPSASAAAPPGTVHVESVNQVSDSGTADDVSSVHSVGTVML